MRRDVMQWVIIILKLYTDNGYQLLNLHKLHCYCIETRWRENITGQSTQDPWSLGYHWPTWGNDQSPLHTHICHEPRINCENFQTELKQISTRTPSYTYHTCHRTPDAALLNSVIMAHGWDSNKDVIKSCSGNWPTMRTWD